MRLHHFGIFAVSFLSVSQVFADVTVTQNLTVPFQNGQTKITSYFIKDKLRIDVKGPEQDYSYIYHYKANWYAIDHSRRSIVSLKYQTTTDDVRASFKESHADMMSSLQSMPAEQRAEFEAYIGDENDFMDSALTDEFDSDGGNLVWKSEGRSRTGKWNAEKILVQDVVEAEPLDVARFDMVPFKELISVSKERTLLLSMIKELEYAPSYLMDDYSHHSFAFTSSKSYRRDKRVSVNSVYYWDEAEILLEDISYSKISRSLFDKPRGYHESDLGAGVKNIINSY